MDAVLKSVEHVPETTFGPGEVLIREGDRQGAIFVLVEGAVAILKGEVRVARIRTPGALFGEMSVLLQAPYTASVVAEGPVRVKAVQDGESFLASSPEVALHTARILAQRLHDSTTYLADLKVQFRDQTDHLGMVDRVVGALLNQQAEGPVRTADRGNDPRL